MIDSLAYLMGRNYYILLDIICISFAITSWAELVMIKGISYGHD